MAAAIDLFYTLTEDELYTALKKSGLYKGTGKKMIIEDVLLVIFAVYFVFSFVTDHNVFMLIMAIISVIFMEILTLAPYLSMKKQAKLLANGKPIKMHLLPQKMVMDDGEKKWDIKLNESSSCRIIDDKLITVITPDKQLVIIPVRAIPREISYEVQSRIFDGTVEK